MSYTDYLEARGYKRVTVERTTLCGIPTGHRVLTSSRVPPRRVEQPVRRVS